MSMDNMDMEYPKIDLIKLLRGLIKSALRLLLPGMILVLLLTGLSVFHSKNSYTAQYEASASFMVKVVNPLYADQQYYNNSVAEQMAKTFPHILTSGLLEEEVKKDLGISSMPAVKASVIGETNILNLKVTSTDPQLSYDVLCSVMEHYPSVAEFVVGPTKLTLMDDSGVPTRPTSSPNYIRPAVIGAFAGAVLWAGLAFLYWITHQTVNDEDELSKIVNLPCLGHLPRVRGVGKRKGSCPILSESNDKFGFNESVRLLRVRVEKLLTQDKCKVLMVTSTIPNEGKTTVAINLATALAQKGKKTLLVDCDLRNPSVGKAFGKSSDLGFTEFLNKECSLDEAFHSLETENLYAVFGGKVFEHPEKLLSSARAAEFMEAARETFDYVILDTPPCAMMADAAEIGALADRILLTVRYDFAVRQQIQDGVQLLGDTNKAIIGTVFNMTTPQLGKGGYYSYYGYGSYGSYGSAKAEEDAKW